MGLLHDQVGYVPPPPPLPKYDPHESEPKWSFTRFRYNMPIEKGPKQWTSIGTQPKSADDPDWRGVIRNNVIEYPMPEPYKFGSYNDTNYFWFDTPDYADPFKKLWYSFKFFFISGWFLTCFKGCFTELPNNSFQAHFAVYKRIAGPWMLAGMAASTTLVTVANLRGKKDDYWNYTIGGLVMASVLGRKNHVQFVRCTIPFIPLALLIKYNAEINGNLIPKLDFRAFSQGITGQSADNGIASGDLRFGFRGNFGDPGRDVRRTW